MFATVKFKDWFSAVGAASDLDSWAFRGHSDATWSLESSLYRNAQRYGYGNNMLQNRENVMLISFQRRAHHYITDPPKFSERLDWLALMQHHGAPTRLLDFTHSFYVASFFATETAVGDYAIWCINLKVLDEVVARKALTTSLPS
jgi:hypothetical protein